MSLNRYIGLPEGHDGSSEKSLVSKAMVLGATVLAVFIALLVIVKVF